MPDTNQSNETRPLLCHDPLDSLNDQTPTDLEAIAVQSDVQTPLPNVQLALLCLLRTLDPMCFFQIFPYINQFVSDLHVTEDPSKVGFYSGLVESSFAFSQLLAIYPWGYLSDRYGRRPVVLVGVMGLAMTTLLFGLSKNFVVLMLTRALAGIASGNVTVIPSMLIEITDKTNQAQAFPFFGVWWPVGVIIGPLVGGLLSNPSTRYPRYFDSKVFREWPYFLPSLVITCFSLFSFVVAWLFLQETHSNTRCGDKVLEHDAIHNASSHSETGTTYNVRQLLAIPIVQALCVSAFALSFLSAAFEVLFVLFCYSPILSGGLAFSPSEIGFALSASGAMAAVLQVFFMPPLLRRFDHAILYHFCMKLWPYVFLSLPLLNIVAQKGLDPLSGQLSKPIIVILWILIALVLSMARVAFLAYSINMLIVKKHVPNLASLGSMMGQIQFCICLARAFSPVYASSLFAISGSSTNFLGRYIWVIAMALMGFSSNSFSKRIVMESSKS